MKRKALAIPAALLLTFPIAACGDRAGESGSTESSTQATTAQEQPLPANVQKVVDALNKLHIEHTTPVKGPTNLSEATEVYDLKINNYDSGISTFQNAKGLNLWQEASDKLGGISVTFGTTAISLNSDQGKQDSLKIAPKLAKELGGTAHGLEDSKDGKPSPTEPRNQSQTNTDQASFQCGDWHLYQAGTAIYSDGSTGYEESCYQPMMDAAQSAPQSYGQVTPDPETIPFANGGTCPAYKCGYGTDENGNPNPSSGELQLMDGCQQGYVDDPERCAAVLDKANQYGW